MRGLLFGHSLFQTDFNTRCAFLNSCASPFSIPAPFNTRCAFLNSCAMYHSAALKTTGLSHADAATMTRTKTKAQEVASDEQARLGGEFNAAVARERAAASLAGSLLAAEHHAKRGAGEAAAVAAVGRELARRFESGRAGAAAQLPLAAELLKKSAAAAAAARAIITPALRADTAAACAAHDLALYNLQRAEEAFYAAKRASAKARGELEDAQHAMGAVRRALTFE